MARKYNRRGARRRAVVRRVKRLPVRRVRRTNIPRSVSVQANIPRIQKLRYVEDITLSYTGGISQPALYQFRANGLYDPNYTSTGHQPLRFDQMSLFYQDYVVVGSKMTIRHVGNGDNSAAQRIVTFLNDVPLALPINMNEMIEQGRGKYMLTNNNAGKAQDRLSCKFSAKKFFNITNIKDNTDRIGSSVIADPADQAYYVIQMESLDKLTNTLAYLQVVIDYIVIFSQPVVLAQS